MLRGMLCPAITLAISFAVALPFALPDGYFTVMPERPAVLALLAKAMTPLTWSGLSFPVGAATPIFTAAFSTRIG